MSKHEPAGTGEVIKETETCVWWIGPGSNSYVSLTNCPACGMGLSGSGRWKRTHLASHDPEDFGLTPIGETRPTKSVQEIYE
jgi:hypothetical protein